MTVILPVANVLVASVGYPLIHFGRCIRLRIFPFPSSQRVNALLSSHVLGAICVVCEVVFHTLYCIASY